MDHGDIGIRKGNLTVIVLRLLLDPHFLLDSLPIFRQELLILSRHYFAFLLPSFLLVGFRVFSPEELQKEGEEVANPVEDVANDVAHQKV